MENIRAAAGLIGRRTVLRYVAIGAAASLAAACTGKGKNAEPAGSGSGASGSAGPGPSPAVSDQPTGASTPASSAPGPTGAGVTLRAFDAFVKGTWNVESTTPGGTTQRGTATVLADGGGNGGFTLV
ncbi:hypothetical protein ACLF6K_01350 [Streptomyces xanthophaeus]|uniref:hypothetical protein n=1 Tax=Streptomyces xanthophaeus TaxID=67385 RepID=UPI00398FEB4A